MVLNWRTWLQVGVGGLLGLSMLVSPLAQSRERGIPALQVAELAREFRLDADQAAQLRASVQRFNQDPYVQVADASSEQIYLKYFCIGVHGALVVVGGKGMKCINTAGKQVWVGFSADPRLAFGAGLAAQDYVGLSAGVSLFTGVMIVRCSISDCALIQGQWGKVANGFSGGGSWGLVGGMLGYYARGESRIVIGAYQAGWSVDLGISGIQILEQRPNQ